MRRGTAAPQTAYAAVCARLHRKRIRYFASWRTIGPPVEKEKKLLFGCIGCMTPALKMRIKGGLFARFAAKAR